MAQMNNLTKLNNLSQENNVPSSAKIARKPNTFLLLIIDFLLISIAYFATLYLRRNTIALSIIYLKLLILIYASWIIISIMFRKFILSSYPNFFSGFIKILLSNIFITFLISFEVLVDGLYAFSRGQVFGTILVFWALESLTFIMFYFTGGKTLLIKSDDTYKKIFTFKDFSIFLLLNDLIYLGISFFAMYYYKRNSFRLTPEYETIFLVIGAVWLIISMFTNKFNKIKTAKYSYLAATYIKSYLLILLTTTVLIFIFRLFYYSRLHFFGTFTILLALEIISSFLNYMTWIFEPKARDIETSDEVKAILKQEDLPIKKDINGVLSREIITPAKEKLHTYVLRDYPNLYTFINSQLDLSKIDESEVTVLDTDTMFNIETIEKHSIHLFVNLHKVNDFKRLNRYFLEVHNKIADNGIFISCAETNEIYNKQLYAKTVRIIARFIYTLHFIFHRIIPKLPWLNKVYFVLTRGKNRALSKAEVLGRLCFCGFTILADNEIGGKFYYVAQRVKYPSVIKNPSYGPTIALPRIGLNGEVQYIYKFRTMHPYSEFLQEYIYEKNKLLQSGKLASDFRMTEWGKLFRKLWIDELPQLINYFRGDLALFGVRALSKHYFDLYPKELQELRTQFKPGLIPPYYADLPKSFDEIVQSEKTYLEKKLKAPFRTDISYLFRAIFNIIFKRARSS